MAGKRNWSFFFKVSGGSEELLALEVSTFTFSPGCRGLHEAFSSSYFYRQSDLSDLSDIYFRVAVMVVGLEEFVRVGERFVVVLPKSVRKRLSLKKGDLLRVSVEGERIVMTPVREEAFEVFRRVLSGIEWNRRLREECEKALVGEAR